MASHGTEARARQHRRAGQPPCAACLEAERQAWADRSGTGRTLSEAQYDVWERRRAGLLPARRTAT